MKIKIDKLVENKNNPRTFNEYKLEQIKKSLIEFPEMLKIRPIVINKDYMILGGNMRYKAALELGWEEVECVILEAEGRENEFIIKDNLTYGDWTWANLVDDYQATELSDWGVELPVWYKDLETSVGEKRKKKQKKEDLFDSIDTKTKKKALYLFYSKSDKSLITDILKENSITNKEDLFINLIKKSLGYESIES